MREYLTDALILKMSIKAAIFLGGVGLWPAVFVTKYIADERLTLTT